jgi:hypothetical protein
MRRAVLRRIHRIRRRLYNIAEANLYDAATGKIVWSARTESQAQGNDEKAIKSYVSQIMKSLRKQNVIP